MKIYSDPSVLPDGVEHIVALYPHWGVTGSEEQDPTWGRYDTWLSEGRSVLPLAPLEEAEAVLFPGKWEQMVAHSAPEDDARSMAEQAAAAGLPFVIFFWSDLADPVDVPGAIVLRTSLYRSTRRPTEHAMPAWSEDFVRVHLGGTLPVRERRAGKPIVGFCGRAPSRRGMKDTLRRLAGRNAVGGHAIRPAALRLLGNHSGIDTRFVIRDAFFASVTASSADERHEALEVARREYVQNMVDSEYVVCARGIGNFSYRLYETLSCGRIPVFVDTDCVLPLENEIDWRSLCVWVDASSLDSIGDRVVAFHESLTDSGFRDLQQECRRTWERYLSPVGFFSHLDRALASEGR